VTLLGDNALAKIKVSPVSEPTIVTPVLIKISDSVTILAIFVYEIRRIAGDEITSVCFMGRALSIKHFTDAASFRKLESERLSLS